MALAINFGKLRMKMNSQRFHQFFRFEELAFSGIAPLSRWISVGERPNYKNKSVWHCIHWH